MKMLITARPGTNRDNLLKNLRSVYDDLHEQSGTYGRTGYKHLVDYLGWANNAVRVLGRQISSADLNQLVLTQRHQQLLAGVGGLAGTDTNELVDELVTVEVTERIGAFEAAIAALDAQTRRWSKYSHFVVPDTTFFIEHLQRLDEADFGPLIEVWESPVNLLIPIIVVDELDGLKQSKDPHTRWRARYTLAVLDRVFEKTTGPARLETGATEQDAHGRTRSEVTAELVFDPPGHVRLPINDDEIIDRALAIEPLADRKVTLITYDTGQSTRARTAGLKVVKLAQPPTGDEPARSGRPTRGNRQDREA